MVTILMHMVLDGGSAHRLSHTSFRTAAITGPLGLTMGSGLYFARWTLPAVIAVLFALAGLSGAQAGEDQPRAAANDGAFNQGAALGRALFPEIYEPKVRLNKRHVKPDSTLADYTTDPGSTKVPGLHSITQQAAQELQRQGAGLGAAGRGYSLADAMADALWRKKVVETFWGHLE